MLVRKITNVEKENLRSARKANDREKKREKLRDDTGTTLGKDTRSNGEVSRGMSYRRRRGGGVWEGDCFAGELLSLSQKRAKWAGVAEVNHRDL